MGIHLPRLPVEPPPVPEPAVVGRCGGCGKVIFAGYEYVRYDDLEIVACDSVCLCQALKTRGLVEEVF